MQIPPPFNRARFLSVCSRSRLGNFSRLACYPAPPYLEGDPPQERSGRETAAPTPRVHVARIEYPTKLTATSRAFTISSAGAARGGNTASPSREPGGESGRWLPVSQGTPGSTRIRLKRMPLDIVSAPFVPTDTTGNNGAEFHPFGAIPLSVKRKF